MYYQISFKSVKPLFLKYFHLNEKVVVTREHYISGTVNVKYKVLKMRPARTQIINIGLVVSNEKI